MEKLFEAHAHYLFDIPLDRTVEIFKEEFKEIGVEKCIFLSIPQESKDGKTFKYLPLQNEKGLFLKKVFSPNGYAFAGLEHPKDLVYTEETADEFLRQAKESYQMGYDGIKMLEGYPQFRKANNIPLNHPVYDKFYSFLEQKNIPITLHVANPPEFWNVSAVDEFVKKAGRVCGEGYPSKAELQKEVIGVLTKHPKLRLALAHFGFLTYDIEETKAFLENYENTVIDITPGGEQFFNIMNNWTEWKEFFEKYQDRLIYGSDFYAFPNEDKEEWKIAFHRRPDFVRQVFETDSEHVYLGESFRGINLDKNIRDKIYRENAERLFKCPRTIDEKAFTQRLKSLLQADYQEKDKEDIRYMLTVLEG